MPTVRQRLTRWWGEATGPRTSGFPTSSNRAASAHLRWEGLPSGERVVEASVLLEVLVAPVVPHLYFWALQASFADGTRRFGGAHLGLQWHPSHPGSTAVNWGGYDVRGQQLTGTSSALPTATGNPNTRDFPWVPARAYRLVIRAGSPPGSWQGAVDGTPVRELSAGGNELVDLMVWSEVFARCDDPSVVVRWREFAATTAGGRPVRPDRLIVSYQSRAEGGCDNTSARVVDGAVEQITAVDRRVPAASALRP